MYHRRPSPSPSSSLTSADVTFDGDGGSSVASPSCSSKSSDSSSCGLLYHHFYMVPPLSSSVKDPPVTVVDVEAPASLSEGYVFWATMPQSDHRSRNKNSNRKRSLSSFPVRVPPGGVESGQTLRVPLLMDEDCHCDRKDCECRASAAHIGQWQDGIFSCFRHGLWHPHLWNAWLCPQILLGQLLVRTKTTRLVQNPFQKEELDDNSVNGADNDKHNSTTAVSIQSAFRKIMILVVLLSLYDALVAPPLFDLQVDKDTGDIVFVRGTGFPVWHQILYVLLSLPMTIWGIMVVVRLRAAIRHKHNIPAGRLGRFEDFVCVCCCNCCVMSQMARQTADYDGDEPASCCSPNGIRTLNKKGHDDDDDEGSSDDDASLNESILRSPVPLESLSSFSSSLSTMSSSSSHSATSVTRRNESRLHNNSLTMATIV